MNQQQTNNNGWLTMSTGLAFGVVLGGSLALAFAPALPVAVGVVATATIMWGVIGYLHEDYQRKLESEKGSERISSSQQEPIVRYENTRLQQTSSSPHLKDKAGTPPDSPSMRAQRSSPFAPNLFFIESKTPGTGGLNVGSTDYTNHPPYESSSQSSATSQGFTPQKLEEKLFGADGTRRKLFPESPQHSENNIQTPSQQQEYLKLDISQQGTGMVIEISMAPKSHLQLSNPPNTPQKVSIFSPDHRGGKMIHVDNSSQGNTPSLNPEISRLRLDALANFSQLRDAQLKADRSFTRETLDKAAEDGEKGDASGVRNALSRYSSASASYPPA